MKVLFLDVDGVLNSAAWFAANPDNLFALDPDAIARVQHIVAQTGVQIVLSSTWRLLNDAVAALIANGLTFLDKTPTLKSNNRGEEIGAWLAAHSVDHFAIVDDDVDAGDHGLRPWLVQTTFAAGLTDRDVAALIALLS